MDKALAIAFIVRSCVPLVCIVACVCMAIVKPESTVIQTGLLTMGATAYQSEKKEKND